MMLGVSFIEIALIGAFIMVAALLFGVVCLLIALSDEERALRYIRYVWRLFAAGLVIWLYGNVLFIMR